jgi:oligopeptide/dipeptide ABC transporter ATP-binding protein
MPGQDAKQNTDRRTGDYSSAGGPVLEVRDLWVHYQNAAGPVKAVDRVSFSLRRGETLGLVGESGSGKTSTALALMRLLDPPTRVGGEVRIDGQDLLALSEEEMRRASFSKISLVTQGAMNSLNPVMRVKPQIEDIFSAHDIKMSGNRLNKRISALLRSVDLKPDVAGMYPHELSGGMKQRVVIAMAIALSPDVIIADEPTSALDVVIQRQVIQTLIRVQRDVGAAMILIGHDMGLMAQVVDQVGVMYAGRLVEVSPVRDIFDRPKHPYAELLVKSLPSKSERGVFQSIPGLTPSLLDLPAGCVFHPRCPYAEEICRVEVPELKPVGNKRLAACHLRREEPQ